MNKYYCHDCAVINGTLRPPPRGDTLTDNPYKLGKYIKHSLPNSSSDFKSVFTGVASESYEQYLVTAVASGHVQVDNNSRINIVWVGSKDIGIALEGGQFKGDMQAVKVVCHSDSNRIHAFPIFPSELRPASCMQCGTVIAC
jgi:hypothetical protein